MDVLKLKWSFSSFKNYMSTIQKNQYFFLDWNKQQQLNEITKICKENFIETAVLSSTAFFSKQSLRLGRLEQFFTWHSSVTKTFAQASF
jgi:hypothetical protein